MKMKLNEAIALARQHVGELYSGQNLTRMAADAFLFDDHLRIWTITLGFLRPDEGTEREHKVIRIADADAQIISVS